MKIVCITEFKSQGLQYELTKDKIYESLSKPNWASEDSYFIMCDRGFISSYNKRNFTTLEEYRNEKIDKLGL